MTHPPTISIIITAFNADRFLAETLDSVLGQTRPDWECIVVDDGSADQTRALAQRYMEQDGRIRVVWQENRGSAAARNRGFAEIGPGTKYVTFLDSDDVWIPEALSILAAELERCPVAIGAHGLADNIDASGESIDEGFEEQGRMRLGYARGSLKPSDLSEPTTFRVLAWTNRAFPPGLLLTRREYYEKAGAFEGFYRRVDDWDMVVRLSRYGDFAFVNKVIISYRRHGGNISATHSSVAKALRQMHHKIFFSPENTEEHKQILREGWRGLQMVHAREKWERCKVKAAKGQLGAAAAEFAGLYVQLHRYVRGYPTLDGI